MHYGQILQSHALHFFHLSSPDLLFGFGSDMARRNIVGVAAAHPEIARQGVLLRKYGQQVIFHTAGKRIHGTGAVPGGVNKSLTAAERDELKKDVYQMISWSREAVRLVRRLFEQDLDTYRNFGTFEARTLSLVRADGAMDLYHGGLRAQHADGTTIFATLGFHWARMIEMLHSAEAIKDLLHDDDLLGSDLMAGGERQARGVGVIEAPRGTLIHHYRVDENDQVARANLIVSTTHNNHAMNIAIREVAKKYLDGQKLTEGLLNHIEVAVRAFDPCLSCATHAMGKMPLAVELVNAEGTVVDSLVRGSA